MLDLVGTQSVGFLTHWLNLFLGLDGQSAEPAKIQNIPTSPTPSLQLAVNVIVSTDVSLKLRLSSKHRYSST